MLYLPEIGQTGFTGMDEVHIVMKILSIISSYRKNGNTERLVKCIEEELSVTAERQKMVIEFETIFLGHTDIQLCHGCRVCFDKGERICPLKDELLYVRDKIQQSDGIILASPVYVEDVNGIMKNWIDRMAFNCHRPAFVGKPAIIVTTSAIGSSNHALKTMNTALNTWGFHIAGRGKFRTGDIMETNEIKRHYNNKIKSTANRLFYEMNNKKVLTPSFYSLIVFKVQQKYWQKTTNDNSFDHWYWENKGWLEANCEYYIELDSNLIKVKFARFIGNIVSLFFI